MQEQDTQNQQATQSSIQKPVPVSMTMQVVTIYCACDDFLKAADWHDNVQAQMTTAEVMTVSLVASAIFDGNQDKSRRFLKEHVSQGTWLHSGHAQ